jgi:RNA polymerase sigma factor (TIGR02999 family)
MNGKPVPGNPDVTLLLRRWGAGDADAFRDLIPVVYAELRRLAAHYMRHERGDHTLQPTALVHEAFLRLSGLRELRLHNRSHFYGAAAGVMRRVLVDHSRRATALKRGGPLARWSALEPEPETGVDLRLDLIALDRALDELARRSPDAARVIELRYFGGLTVEDAAEHLGVAPATVKRRWTIGRAWLFRALDEGTPGHEP